MSWPRATTPATTRCSLVFPRPTVCSPPCSAPCRAAPPPRPRPIFSTISPSISTTPGARQMAGRGSCGSTVCSPATPPSDATTAPWPPPPVSPASSRAIPCRRRAAPPCMRCSARPSPPFPDQAPAPISCSSKASTASHGTRVCRSSNTGSPRFRPPDQRLVAATLALPADSADAPPAPDLTRLTKRLETYLATEADFELT